MLTIVLVKSSEVVSYYWYSTNVTKLAVMSLLIYLGYVCHTLIVAQMGLITLYDYFIDLLIAVDLEELL